MFFYHRCKIVARISMHHRLEARELGLFKAKLLPAVRQAHQCPSSGVLVHAPRELTRKGSRRSKNKRRQLCQTLCEVHKKEFHVCSAIYQDRCHSHQRSPNRAQLCRCATCTTCTTCKGEGVKSHFRPCICYFLATSLASGNSSPRTIPGRDCLEFCALGQGEISVSLIFDCIACTRMYFSMDICIYIHICYRPHLSCLSTSYCVRC